MHPRPNLSELLLSLADAGIEFILVGGLAAVSQGVPRATMDVDIVHRRSAENCRRLHDFLIRHDARYRHQLGERIIRPALRDLQGPGHHLLATDLGFLDVLGVIEHGCDFDQLDQQCVVISLEQRSIRMLTLSAIKRLKTDSTEYKDRELVAMIESLERLDPP